MTHWRAKPKYLRDFRRAWLAFTVSLFLGSVALFAWASIARGDECPPDRPIKKTVSTGMATCTVMACFGRLVCPANPSPLLPGIDCYRLPAENCNTCTPVVNEICLSQEELDAAK